MHPSCFLEAQLLTALSICHATPYAYAALSQLQREMEANVSACCLIDKPFSAFPLTCALPSLPRSAYAGGANPATLSTPLSQIKALLVAGQEHMQPILYLDQQSSAYDCGIFFSYEWWLIAFEVRDEPD